MPGERAPAYLNRAMEIKSKLERAGAQQEDGAFALQVLRGLADDWQEINKVFRYQQGTLTSADVFKAVAQEQRQRDYTEERKKQAEAGAVCPVGQRESTQKDREGPQEGQGRDPRPSVLQGSRAPFAPVPQAPQRLDGKSTGQGSSKRNCHEDAGDQEGASGRRVCQAQGTAIRTNENHEGKGTPGPRQPGLAEDESDEEEGGYVPIPPKERAMMAIAHTPRMEMCALSRTKGVWYMDEWLHHTHVLPGRAL